jgi:hypothetical protein
MVRCLFALLALAAWTLPSAADIGVREIRIQRDGDVTYVLAVLHSRRPALPIVNTNSGLSEGELRDLAVRPRLVPQDQRSLSVYRVLESAGNEATPGLPFVGRWSGGQLPETVRCLLLYPIGEEPSPDGAVAPDTRRLMPRHVWREANVTLDLRRARVVPDDLDDFWARPGRRNWPRWRRSHGVPFFGLAREALARRYGVRPHSGAIRAGRQHRLQPNAYDDTVAAQRSRRSCSRRLAGHGIREGRRAPW